MSETDQNKTIIQRQSRQGAETPPDGTRSNFHICMLILNVSVLVQGEEKITKPHQWTFPHTSVIHSTGVKEEKL